MDMDDTYSIVMWLVKVIFAQNSDSHKLNFPPCVNAENAVVVFFFSLQWRHNERDSVSNHQPHDSLFNCLFRRRSKKASKLRVTGLCVGNSPVTDEFPAQRASNAENVSIWWRHHVWDYASHAWRVCGRSGAMTKRWFQRNRTTQNISPSPYPGPLILEETYFSPVILLVYSN